MRPGIGKMAAFPSIWGHWAGGQKMLVSLVARLLIVNRPGSEYGGRQMA